MKQIIKIIIFILSLLVTVSISACGGGSDGGSDGGGGGGGITFSTPDLEGTWYHLLKGSTTYGSLTMDDNGDVLGGSFFEINGSEDGIYEITGAASITSSGKILGSLTTDDGTPPPSPALVAGPTHIIIDGQMSRDKGLLAIACTNPNAKMGLFIKSVTGFSLSDLAGQWAFGNQNGHGTFTVTGSSISGGSYTRVTGSPVSGSLVPNTLTVAGDGEVGGSFNIGSVNYTILDGQMSSDKNVLYIALADGTTGADNAFIAVKMNADFSQDQPEDVSFKFVSYSDTSQVGYGSFNIAVLSGQVSGDWTSIGVPGKLSFQNENIGIDTAGVITGSIDTSDLTTHNILRGQLSSNKNLALMITAMTGTRTGFEVILFIRK